MGTHGVGVHVNLVLADESPHGGDFADAIDRHQLEANIPVLYRAQLFEVPTAHWIPVGVSPFKRIPVDLPEGRGVRTQSRLYTFWKSSRG